MTLQVPFDEFARAAEHVAGVKEAFVASHPSGCLVTCANPAKGAHVVAVSELSAEEAKKRLDEQGIKAFDGVWSIDGDIDLEEDPLSKAFIAAVSYVSSQHIPGVWVDAYVNQPNHVQVLKAMFDEFRQTGELPEVPFEEFIRLSNPNVVVVSATQLRSFLHAKKDAESKC